MTDEELLELVERVRNNLVAISQTAIGHLDPWDDDVKEFNSELQRLIAADIDVSEWVIPESLVRPSYGRRRLPSGADVRINRVRRGEFTKRANPVLAYLDREVARRRAASGDSSMATRPAGDPSEVWVIYGHDLALKNEIFDLLTNVRLHPIEFTAAVRRSGSGSPHTLDVVINAIQSAPAVIALWSPDETAELVASLRRDPAESQAGFQPRPNVLVETGMALAVKRDRTIVVATGRLRDVTDVEGIHEVRWSDDPAQNSNARHDLVHRLGSLGCPVNTGASSAWMQRPR
jgi:predicted nucleotide-binding protein